MKMDSRVQILSPEWEKQRKVQTTYGVGTVGEIEIKSHQKGRKDMRTEPLRFIRVAPADRNSPFLGETPVYITK